ncbi:MAG: type II secretion system protein GspN [Desulfobacterales bacterium]|nr:type II secretion system protein GspN [Desulfobacterales bacterium]
MFNLKNIKKSYIINAGFFIFITIVFIYALFPSESVKRYTEIKINQNENIDVKIGSAAPLLPPGISYRDVCISYQGKKIECISKLKVYPSYVSLFSGFNICGDILNGNFDADIKDNGKSVYAELDSIKLEKFNFKLIPNIPNDLKISGILKSIISIDMENGSQKSNIESQVENLHINLNKFPLKNISFKDIKLSLSINKKNMNIKNLTFSGPDINGTIKGSIIVNSNPYLSRLNLTFNIEPTISFIKKTQSKIPLKSFLGNKKSISIVLKGTPSKPQWGFK